MKVAGREIKMSVTGCQSTLSGEYEGEYRLERKVEQVISRKGKGND